MISFRYFSFSEILLSNFPCELEVNITYVYGSINFLRLVFKLSLTLANHPSSCQERHNLLMTSTLRFLSATLFQRCQHRCRQDFQHLTPAPSFQTWQTASQHASGTSHALEICSSLFAFSLDTFNLERPSPRPTLQKFFPSQSYQFGRSSFSPWLGPSLASLTPL